MSHKMTSGALQAQPFINELDFRIEQEDDFFYCEEMKELLGNYRTILEWSARSPYIEPFPKDGVKSKDQWGLRKYKYSVLEFVDMAFSYAFMDKEIEAPDHTLLAEEVVILFNVVKEWVLGKERGGKKIDDYRINFSNSFFDTSSKNDRDEIASEINEIAYLMHKEIMDCGYREKVKSFKRNSKNCYQRMLRVCSRAWERHSAILLLRLDWGYKVTYPDNRGVFSSEKNYTERFSKVCKNREKMIEALHDMFGDALIFYFWKIECTTKKGLHIHWMIGLNGSKHQDKINVPMRIAKAWDECVNDVGSYTWNVGGGDYGRKSYLEVINYDHPMLWKVVSGYANYLAKVDYLIRHRTPIGMRSFGGTKYIDNKINKRGPKRSKKMELLNINQDVNFPGNFISENSIG